MEEKIEVLIVNPGEYPVKIEMENTLEALQQAVGGYIEVLPIDSKAVVICDEEGKCKGLMPNRCFYTDSEMTKAVDVIYGPFIVAYIAGDKFAGIPPDETDEYIKLFKNPKVQFKRDEKEGTAYIWI